MTRCLRRFFIHTIGDALGFETCVAPSAAGSMFWFLQITETCRSRPRLYGACVFGTACARSTGSVSRKGAEPVAPFHSINQSNLLEAKWPDLISLALLTAQRYSIHSTRDKWQGVPRCYPTNASADVGDEAARCDRTFKIPFAFMRHLMRVLQIWPSVDRLFG